MSKGSNKVIVYAASGFELGASILLFAGAGVYADRHLGTIPVFIIIGTVIGFALGMFLLTRTVSGTRAEDDNSD